MGPYVQRSSAALGGSLSAMADKLMEPPTQPLPVFIQWYLIHRFKTHTVQTVNKDAAI